MTEPSGDKGNGERHRSHSDLWSIIFSPTEKAHRVIGSAASTLGSSSVFLGLALLVHQLTTTWIDWQLDPWNRPYRFNGLFWVGGFFLLLGLALSFYAYLRTKVRKAGGYDEHLAQLGFALVGMGIVTFIALGGLASRGFIEIVLSSKSEVFKTAIADLCQEKEPALCRESVRVVLWTARLALMPAFAVLGSLFFVSGSLQRLRGDSDPNEPFSGSKFWSGFWYRSGEAILFSLVMFLAFRANLFQVLPTGDAVTGKAAGDEGGNSYPEFLMLLGLVMAMFVKPAERLVNGLALRLFDAVGTLTERNLGELAGVTADPLKSLVERMRDPYEPTRMQAIEELSLQSPRHYQAVLTHLASFVRARSREEGDKVKAAPDVRWAFEKLVSLSPPPGQKRAFVSLEGARLGRVVASPAASLAGYGLQNVRFDEAQLADVSFEGADLTGAQLTGANLLRAIFAGAELNSVSFQDADVKGADFTGAKNADLSGAKNAPADAADAADATGDA